MESCEKVPEFDNPYYHKSKFKTCYVSALGYLMVYNDPLMMSQKEAPMKHPCLLPNVGCFLSVSICCYKYLHSRKHPGIPHQVLVSLEKTKVNYQLTILWFRILGIFSAHTWPERILGSKSSE